MRVVVLLLLAACRSSDGRCSMDPAPFAFEDEPLTHEQVLDAVLDAQVESSAELPDWGCHDLCWELVGRDADFDSCTLDIDPPVLATDAPGTEVAGAITCAGTGYNGCD